MKQFRKLFAVLLALAMIAAVFAGCGGSDTGTPATTADDDAGAAPADDGAGAADAGTGDKIRIGFSNASISNSWRVKMRQMLVEACEELGVELIETDANDNANQQNSDIESLLQKDLDAILIAPAVEDAVNPGIEMAYDSGIPVILFDRIASTEKYTTFVTYSDRECGIATAEMLVEGLIERNGEAKGKIICLDSMAGSSTDRLIREGWDEVLANYPDIEVVARQYTDFERSKAKDFMEDCLLKFPSGEIDGILSQDGGATLGALDSLEEAGRLGDNLVITNVDGSNGVCKAIKEGKVYGLAQFPCRCSVDALMVAIDAVNGNMPASQLIEMEVYRVTAANVDEYYIEGGDEYDYTL